MNARADITARATTTLGTLHTNPDSLCRTHDSITHPFWFSHNEYYHTVA